MGRYYQPDVTDTLSHKAANAYWSQDLCFWPPSAPHYMASGLELPVQTPSQTFTPEVELIPSQGSAHICEADEALGSAP